MDGVTQPVRESPHRIRCVVFDAVGTLIVPDPGVGEIYQTVARRYGSKLTLSEIKMRFRSVMSSRLPTLQTNEDDEREFWRATVSHVVGHVNSPEACFQELYEHFAHSESWKLLPDVADVLRTLSSHGIRTAIASNFDTRLRRLLDQMPDLQGFDEVIISSEIGWRKPHPEFFNILQRKLELSPLETLMVGDDFELDILPARAAGMHAFLVNGAPSPGTSQSGEARSPVIRDVLRWCRID